MRILIAGASWGHPMYEAAWKAALERMGNEVVSVSLSPSRRNIVSRIEQRYSILGPYSAQIQEALKQQVRRTNPDVVLIWLGHGVFSDTVKAIREYGKALVVSYVHDDPFAHRFHDLSPRFHRWLWRAFINALPHYDLALFSKQQNVDDAYRFGCKKAAVLPQYFVPEIHYPRVLTDEEDYFRCDVAFAGHFEPDGRDRHIRQLVDSGLKVNVYGDFTWKGTPTKGWPENFTHLPRADGDVYPRALSGASMCLCFMSKMNRDQYTTRCFEIPACGSVLVCERTVPLTQLFKEDEEAIFFATSEELVRKALYLKENTAVRCEIAHAGLKKVHSAGHSVEGRAGDFLSLVNLLLRG